MGRVSTSPTRLTSTRSMVNSSPRTLGAIALKNAARTFTETTGVSGLRDFRLYRLRRRHLEDKELEDRLALVASARTWLNTPYHHRGRVKGVGCDCAQLIAMAHCEAGLLPYIEPHVYSMDWHLHRGEEKYLTQVDQALTLVDDTLTPVVSRPATFQLLPGDVLMFRLGRTFSHSAMVTQWPRIIHAYAQSQIVEEVDINGTPMAY